MAVGASLDGKGIVYMYKYYTTGFEVNMTLVQPLSTPDEALDATLFGVSVSLFDVAEVSAPEASQSATVAIGAPAEPEDPGDPNFGAVFVYYAINAANPTWNLQDTIIPREAGVSGFGKCVSIYAETLVSYCIFLAISRNY